MYNNYQRKRRDDKYHSGNGNLGRITIKNDFFQRDNYSRNRKLYNFKRSNNGDSADYRNRKLQNFKRFNNDDPMDNMSSRRKSRFTPYSDSRKNADIWSRSMWFKVTLANGNKYNQEELFNKLRRYLEPVQLIPICCKVEDEDLSFYIDNETTATALKNANLKIHLADEWKLQIKVFSYKLPNINFDQNMKEKVALVVAKRYQTSTNTLDLSKFYMDEDLLRHDLLLPFTQTPVLLAVLQIIIRDIPHIRKIILSNNKLTAIEPLSIMSYFTKNLKMLDLSFNRIRQLRDISLLEGLELQEINLDCNPLCNQYDNKDSYVRELRKIFPTLEIVDGVHFESAGLLVGSEPIPKLPTAQKIFIIPEAVPVVKQIIQEYYTMFDNYASRRGLMDAYHSTAQFSMSAYFNRGSQLQKLVAKSRNMLIIRPSRRASLLSQGWGQILDAIEEFPKTKHDLNALNIDLSFHSPERIVLTITGVFQEENLSVPQHAYDRSFSRIFVVVRENGAFKITNDILTVSGLSKQHLQLLKWTKLLEIPNIPSQLADSTEPSPSSIPDPVQQELDVKRQMIRTLAVQTGMNLKWSEKCLVETNWNFDNAVQAFTEINAKGMVPPDAFMK